MSSYPGDEYVDWIALDGYDFDEAFRKPFLPKSKHTVQAPEAKPAQSPEAKS